MSVITSPFLYTFLYYSIFLFHTSNEIKIACFQSGDDSLLAILQSLRPVMLCSLVLMISEVFCKYCTYSMLSFPILINNGSRELFFFFYQTETYVINTFQKQTIYEHFASSVPPQFKKKKAFFPLVIYLLSSSLHTMLLISSAVTNKLPRNLMDCYCFHSFVTWTISFSSLLDVL